MYMSRTREIGKSREVSSRDHGALDEGPLGAGTARRLWAACTESRCSKSTEIERWRWRNRRQGFARPLQEARSSTGNGPAGSPCVESYTAP